LTVIVVVRKHDFHMPSEGRRPTNWTTICGNCAYRWELSVFMV